MKKHYYLILVHIQLTIITNITKEYLFSSIPLLCIICYTEEKKEVRRILFIGGRCLWHTMC